ncbi:GNAT family N-acetyltransferase [Clostridium hydrogeniformans]|uniref:GNAT family N-acetyltransferase n=1 Tax=Clostridium hydrogeniformans TaxID=349933 RepID=UPI000484D639|nr:GNAT family N-acetyltransferase [Clostridium hydrogeniformans]
MYKIHKLIPNTLTNGEIENLYLTNKNIVEKYSLLDQFRNPSEYKDLFLSTFNEPYNELFVLKKDSLIFGILNIIKSADWSGREQYKLSIHLCDLILNESILDTINQLIQEKLYEYGELAVITLNNELEELIKKYTSKVNSRANYYTLKKDDIDIDLLNKSIEEYERNNKDFSIKYTDFISDELIDEYCNLFMETMKDMTDEKEDGYVSYTITPEKQRQINMSNKEKDITHNCYMIFNSQNEMVAKSNVRVSNKDHRFPYQFMIGVKREYRGRNFGKWMYASMYKRLFENVDFEKVFVCHHTENKHAINVSEWVGYKFGYLETIHILYK